ncbi:hypothetical protein GCM10027343_36320 [Noviherbaspirillum agri]
MKTHASMAALLAAANFIAATAAAQNVQPGETSRPVVPAAKAGEQGTGGTAGTAASPAINVTVAEIAERPRDYVGRNVTVTSEVDEVFTPWALKLDEDQLAAGGIDRDLLVISKEPLVTMGFNRAWIDRKVSITGTVRVLQADDFRREYGRGVDDRMFRRYEGRPALVARSMAIVGTVPESGASGASGSSGADQASGRDNDAANAAANDSGANTGITMKCRPSSVGCPVTDSSGSSVTSTDSQPLGSIPPRDDTISESQYPTSPGSGSLGSGSTGSPAGRPTGPTNGIGR